MVFPCKRRNLDRLLDIYPYFASFSITVRQDCFLKTETGPKMLILQDTRRYSNLSVLQITASSARSVLVTSAYFHLFRPPYESPHGGQHCNPYHEL